MDRLYLVLLPRFQRRISLLLEFNRLYILQNSFLLFEFLDYLEVISENVLEIMPGVLVCLRSWTSLLRRPMLPLPLNLNLGAVVLNHLKLKSLAPIQRSRLVLVYKTFVHILTILLLVLLVVVGFQLVKLISLLAIIGWGSLIPLMLFLILETILRRRIFYLLSQPQHSCKLLLLLLLE